MERHNRESMLSPTGKTESYIYWTGEGSEENHAWNKNAEKAGGRGLETAAADETAAAVSTAAPSQTLLGVAMPWLDRYNRVLFR